MQIFTAPLATSYKIECWGAQSGGYEHFIGLGAYTVGYIDISQDFTLYIFVGQSGSWKRSDQSTSGTFNGGGGFIEASEDKNNATGGGATDIRLQNGNWDNFSSLKSRIMVAAGGGSCIFDSNYNRAKTYGGALFTPNYTNTFGGSYTNAAQGATQTSGYKFGIGQDGGRAGAGGGYYGGCAIVQDENEKIGLRGAGGSSFISGYSGCDAIAESSTEDNIIHTGQPNHYSGKVFSNSVMIAGNASMPKPKGGIELGHSGDGYCIISWISPSL